MSRKKIVAGNWKMNTSLEEGKKLASEIVNMVNDELNDDVKVILNPPYTHLSSLLGLIEGSSAVTLGAQNCSEHVSGAYTGEISAATLKAMGVSQVILGHSERREYFGENDALIAKKIKLVLEQGMEPIYCCGEVLEIREAGSHVGHVCSQIEEALFHLDANDLKKVVIAYEPVWAIGTGKTASPEQAQEMHEALRAFIAGKYGSNLAEEISILYGGSCKPSNAKQIFAGKDVDGGLIGGASLNARDFVDIIKSF